MEKLWKSSLPRWLGLGLILFGIAFSTSGMANSDRQNNEIPTLIEQARDAWMTRDADAFAQLFALNGELIVPGGRWQGRAKIREEISRFTQQYSQVHIDIRGIIVDGNQAAVEWHYEDTEKATGKRHRADDAIIVDFREGKITRWREYFDTKTPVNNS